MSDLAVDFDDIQGLVRFGHSKLTDCSFYLLNIHDAAAARAWLASAPVSNAVQLDDAPQAALQVAFTSVGLQALGVGADVLAGFSDEFLNSMVGEENRSRRLGDVGTNDPQHWSWGGPGKIPHLIVMLYARPGRLAAWTQTVQGAKWDTAFEVVAFLPTSNTVGFEPFGFADGLSQPALDWQRQRDPHGDRLTYSNLVALGEFLLGYPNEYGRYTDRPLLDRWSPAASLLAMAEDVPAKCDLGRNGTYLVFRQLQQDVNGFWRFVDQQANSNPQAREALAESMVGRKLNGDPLVPLLSQAIEGVDATDGSQNQFTFDSDPGGTKCPLGAHIRRANPRNADIPGDVKGLVSWLLHTFGLGSKKFRYDVLASTRFHRVLRRGRQFGAVVPPEHAKQPGYPIPGERGIYLLAINANISRQFEFVQGAWVMSTKFNAMTEESDPLLGNRSAIPGCAFTNTFSLPQESGLRTRITGMPQFVTVRGGAYFFLPGLRALQYLAALDR